MSSDQLSAQIQRRDPDGVTRWYRFNKPEQVLQAGTVDEVIPLLENVEAHSEQGGYAVGYVTYEAASAFDRKLCTREPLPELPLAWFALYAEAEACAAPHGVATSPEDVVPQWDLETFSERVQLIREWIEKGHTYQVNLTYPLRAQAPANPRALFHHLSSGQQACHQAWLETDQHWIASASPELFFRRNGRKLTCRPMKGTAPRTEDPRQDAEQKAWLQHSEKNRAENLMIVDMIRNDLGKIADPGSIRVPNLHEIETYPTLFQMTSTVEAESDAGLVELFKALFPCASITGAPKRRTMELIRDLESGPRGVYTGAIGSVFPGGDAEFSVAIRTAVINRRSKQLRYGTGCGIVWDSEAEAEYRESQIKTRVLTRDPEPFELIETMKWLPGVGVRNLDAHVARMRTSAAALGFSFSATGFLDLVNAISAPDGQRLRMLLNPDGRLDLSTTPLATPTNFMSFSLDTVPTPSDRWELRHKTTRRTLYAEARTRCPNADEPLLINERGELMEFSIGNLVLEIDGVQFTPPLRSGCLPGTTRARMLQTGALLERVLYRKDLDQAGAISLINAVRGQVPMQSRCD